MQIKVYNNICAGQFLSVPTKLILSATQNDKDHFLDALYFARYFRKLKHGDVEQLRSLPHYKQLVNQYKNLLTDVDISDICAVEKALKYNIEVFNPFKKAAQIGGEAVQKRKSYPDIHLLKISKHRYKPIIHLGGSSSSPAPAPSPAPRTTSNRSSKRTTVRAMRSGPPVINEPSTKLERQILDDLKSVQTLNDDNTKDFCDRFLNNPIYANVSKYVPTFIFHLESDAQQGGGYAVVTMEDYMELEKAVVRADYYNDISKSRILDVIDELKKKELNNNFKPLINELYEKVGKYEMKNGTVSDVLYDVLESLRRRVKAATSQSAIEATKKGTIEAAVKETKAKISEIESDTNAKAGETTQPLKSGGYLTLYLARAFGTKNVKALWAIISQKAKPFVDSLRITDTTKDFFNQLKELTTAQLSNKNEKTLRIYRSFAVCMFVVVLHSFSGMYTGINVTSETLAISGVSAPYVKEVQETFSKEPQKYTENHDQFATAQSYTDNIAEQAKRITPDDTKRMKKLLDQGNVDELYNVINEFRGGGENVYPSPIRVLNWAKHVMKVQTDHGAVANQIAGVVGRTLDNPEFIGDAVLFASYADYLKNELTLLFNDVADVIETEKIPWVDIGLDKAGVLTPMIDYFSNIDIGSALGHAVGTFSPFMKGIPLSKRSRFITSVLSNIMVPIGNSFIKVNIESPMSTKNQKTILDALKSNHNKERLDDTMLFQRIRNLVKTGKFRTPERDAERRLLAVTMVSRYALTEKNYLEFLKHITADDCKVACHGIPRWLAATARREGLKMVVREGKKKILALPSKSYNDVA